MSEAMDVDTLGPRGIKRKADEDRPLPQPLKRIKALDQDVVNKIAAGEIIAAPVNALKELIENSVDAGSTFLEIVVKEGGLKLLQITDNGHGINKDDMPILCERFTTSKLKAFEDLMAIGTYGFRGEALASISHIAHLTVTTKTTESSCAWRAHYLDGKLAPAKPGQTAEPKPTAGRGGTQITVEDLFYNVRQRKLAFKSPSEEYAKILDIVGKYGIHCKGVGFSCKKHADSAMGVSIPSNAGTIDRIRHIYGTTVANELIQFDVSDDRLGFKANGWTSNANYHAKKTTLLLFINSRSVESSAVKKAVDNTYSNFLPKGGHPFLYLSVDIEPSRVDVNVHPTKREVNFLNEDEIIECICNTIANSLSKVDTSRTFMTQTLLPGTKIPTIDATSTPTPSHDLSRRTVNARGTPVRPHQSNLVRTDSKLRKITSMLPPSSSSQLQSLTTDPTHITYTTSEREHILCRLTSVRDLRAAVRASTHSKVTELIASHTYVGLVDSHKRIAAIQSGVQLLLVDYGMFSTEYFYQLGLTDFGNFGTIKFNPPLDIKDLITMATETERKYNATKPQPDNVDWSEVSDIITAQLVSRRDMIAEYFNFSVTESGELESIPLLLKNYTPSLAKLPRFLMRLGPCVDWTNEGRCFHTFLKELASFYSPEQIPEPSQIASKSINNTAEAAGADADVEGEILDEARARPVQRRDNLARTLEHVLFPAFKSRLVATKGLLKGVVEVADLRGLYRVFERC
ncbi:MAG: DNA mismatch repair protein [Icmadophila ericetorum]|nr:DNA mismatch repair protein [Icmadophila ericetorum]